MKSPRNRTILKTDIQLQNCINANKEVEVWFAGSLDCQSEIRYYTDEVVVFEEGSYLRSNCILKIKGSHLQLVK
ncbi:hypothetical protein GCM10008018_66280 [Paenibacillus marchantiophytorum]|uniref:Uncharacterized protein n=1 Tax=Paenibacillus marchantiophytorum TaxID=1619310 RepID=A0ABQ1FH73_9BACL|nr:hypothetical protein GCM10008018_66280 [Paenibacillus marchantiophytorum]